MRIFFLCLFLTLVGCGASEEEATCLDAVDSFYSQGCVLGQDNSLTEREAQSLCLELKSNSHAKAPQCDDDVQRWVNCLASVNPGDCSECNGLVEKFLTCS